VPFWEGAILQRPVFTVLDPRYEQSQTQTVHFSYFFSKNGSVVRSADALDLHLDQISFFIAENGQQTETERKYMLCFLRPKASEGTSTALLSNELETSTDYPILPIRYSITQRIFRRIALGPVSYFLFEYYKKSKRIKKDLKLKSPYRLKR
jgi:hypothetical protein